MKHIFKAALFATALIGSSSAAVLPAFAQSVPFAGGVAIADLDEAISKSNAGVLATNQIQLTYKAQIDAAQARAQALNTELQGLRTAIGTAQRAPNPNQPAIQAQVAAYQKREAEAQREVQTLSQPFQLANAYSREQIAAKLEAAARAAMGKKKVGLLIKPEAAILNGTSYDLTADIITEINALVANVGITPPAGWQPGQGAAGTGARPAPGAAAKPAPTGR